MSLSTAFTIANSAFIANAAQSAVVSQNIANANTPGYSKETANVGTNAYGGVEVDTTTRDANAALQMQVGVSTSESARTQTISTALGQLARTVSDSSSSTSATGATQNGGSPSAMIGNLQSALQTLATDPSNVSAEQAVVTAASQAAGALNAGGAATQGVRETADAGMASSVATINALLGQYSKADAAVVNGIQSGANVSQAQDTRDSILTQLSQQLGVTSAPGSNGSLSIYTDSGVTLFEGGQPRSLTFAATPAFTSGSSGNPVLVEGVPITGPTSPMAIQSGALAGDAAVRDTIAPQYQAQLDQIAGGLISAFSESDQSATPTQPRLPGLFTFPGATGVPSPNQATGLAASIQVNANVDPSQGGNLSLLQNGGISQPGNPAYDYNPTGAAGFTGRIQQLVGNLSAPQAFSAAAGLGASASLTTYASSSVGWVQGQNQQAATQASYQGALLTQATSALSNATGVNMDTELTTMLTLENSYSSTAKLLTTVQAMFTALLNAA